MLEGTGGSEEAGAALRPGMCPVADIGIGGCNVQSTGELGGQRCSAGCLGRLQMDRRRELGQQMLVGVAMEEQTLLPQVQGLGGETP